MELEKSSEQNLVFTENFVGKKVKMELTDLSSKNGSIHEGIIYKDKGSDVPYQLLDETEEGKIRGIHIENKLGQEDDLLKSRTFGTWFYHENVPLPGDPENRRYRDRKEFLDNHGHNSQ